jgi:hypothetical protein
MVLYWLHGWFTSLELGDTRSGEYQKRWPGALYLGDNLPNKYEEGEETDRVYARLPIKTIEEIDRYSEQSGLVRGQFLAASIVIGSRVLARQLNPEQFMTSQLADKVYTPALMAQMKEIMGDPEQLKTMFTAFSEAEKQDKN